MQTRCPNCDTHFRVTPAQIKARTGTVRCGQCSFVFNALDTLLEDSANTLPSTELITSTEPPYPHQSPAPLAEETRIAIAEETDTVVADETPTSTFNDDSMKSQPEAMAEEITAVNEDESSSHALEYPLEFPLENPLDATDKYDNVTDADVDDVPPTLDDYLANPYVHEATAPTSSWPWILGTVVVVLGLLLQATYYYRVELAVLRPELRPILQAACKPLQCEVPRPRYVNNLSIESSDLRPDPQQPGHLTLTATLHSKASYAQEWPMLELTLTDVTDSKLAVKHFSARDYLPKNKNYQRAIADGFNANSEVAVALPLDVGTLPAAGYRLYVFYP